MSKFKRRNLEETLKLIKSYSSGTLKSTQFSQALGGKGSTRSSTFLTNIADLKFYGLIEYLDSGDYRFSKICSDIKEAKYPKAVEEGKISAFLHSDLFKEDIYREYYGRSIEFNAIVIKDIANRIKKTPVYVTRAIEVFIESGIFADAVTRKPNNTVLIKDVDDIIGSPVKVEPTKDELKETPDKPPVESTRRRQRITPDDHEPPMKPLNFGINFTLDGSTTSEMAEIVFDFLREAGIGEKKKHQLELYVTEPPLKKELLEAVEKMIHETEKEITIVTPYLDSQVLDILIPRAKEGIKVMVITRTFQHTKGTEPKAAWTDLAEDLNINHQCYDALHSRMILKDKSIILVSSADISHDSLEGQFNAGILTDNPVIVKRGETFIEALLKKSKKSKTQ